MGVPTWAVFADEKGKPIFAPIACLGIVEIREGVRVVAGFPIGQHIEPADGKEGFVGYVASTEITPTLAGNCVNKAKEVAEAKKEANKPKFILPTPKKIAEWQGSN